MFSKKADNIGLPRVLPIEEDFVDPGLLVVKDISLLFIQYEGLPTLLRSKIPLLYFMIYCLTGKHAERVLFILEIQNIKKLPANERYLKSKSVYVDYFTESGQLMLDLTPEMKRTTKELIQLNEITAFDQAQMQIIKQLQPTFVNFLKSDVWKRALENLGLRSDKRTMIHGQKLIRDFESLIVYQIKNGKSPCYTTKSRKLFWHSIGQLYKN